MSWKPEWIEFSQALMDTGATQQAIADGVNEKFGTSITRSAVAGQITRGNLVPNEAWKANAVWRQARGRREANEERRRNKTLAPRRTKQASAKYREEARNRHKNSVRRGGMSLNYILPKNYVEIEEPQTEEGRTFADLGQHDCRWWIGNDADGAMRFCACPVHRQGAFYCSDHQAKSLRIVNEENLRKELDEAMAVA